MCGRYTLSVGHEKLARAFLAEFSQDLKASWKPRYNISPGTGIVAVLEDRDRGGRKADVFHWGLVPGWAKDPNIGYKLTNARAETIAEKPTYRDAYRYRRCIVPANGFYEWDRRKAPRQPYYFYPAKGDFLAMAGIWEHWMHPSGSEILSVSLITTAANKKMSPIHHRMPVLVQEKDYDGWLNTGNVKAIGLENVLQPADEGALNVHPVGMKVNKTEFDGPELVEEVKTSSGASDQLDLFGDYRSI